MKNRAGILKALRKVMQTKEYREKQSRIMKEYFSNKKNRAKRGKEIKKWWTKEKRDLWSKKLKNRYEDKKLKNKISNSLKKYFKKNPRSAEIKEKIDRAVTKWWNEHPALKLKAAERLKDYFLNHKKDFVEKMMNGKNNPNKPHLKTPLGMVRSLGEKRIAYFLYYHKIKAIYEGRALVLDGWPCVPDFYLPDYKVYIEFYGGYPGSWKKKVLKNKLYKKHKIKVIAITPGELNNLDEEIRL